MLKYKIFKKHKNEDSSSWIIIIKGTYMKKILFLSTYGDFLATFEYSNITICRSLGARIYCASNFNNQKYNLKTSKLDDLGVIKYELEFDRKPFSKKNLYSFAKLKKLILKEHIDIIDCHNAVVGAYARIAAKPVSYTHLTLPTICSV